LDWPTTAQWAFWHLVHAEGIPGEWLIQLLPKLKSSQHAEAAANVLLMLKRADRDPNMNMLRAFFSRTPLSDDTFTIDCIKILIEDPSTCKRVSDNVGNLLKKQMAAGDLHIGGGNKGASKKSPQKLSMEQVLAHLEHFTQLCLMKEKKIAEQIFSNATVLEAFTEAEKWDFSLFHVTLKLLLHIERITLRKFEKENFETVGITQEPAQPVKMAHISIQIALLPLWLLP
uniref:SOSS complex subunit A homolog n=1 Tax=Angiostrongylus cantonensis TaxID=6313 RepID=A0A0K0DNP8_ANGCA